MTTYRALKKQKIRVFNGDVEIKAGELVDFPVDPGEDWEKVSKRGSDSGTIGGTVDMLGSGRRDADKTGV